MPFTPEYLENRIAYHRDHVVGHVLAHARFDEQGVGDGARSLDTAAKHAAIFTALAAIAAGK